MFNSTVNETSGMKSARGLVESQETTQNRTAERWVELRLLTEYG